MSVPQPDDGDTAARFNESIGQMMDPDRYAALRALSFAERHDCPVEDCRLSAEEHHRLMFGVMAELRALRRGDSVTEPEPEVLPLPAYHVGFVAGANAIIEMMVGTTDEAYIRAVIDRAREQGFIA